MIGLDLSDRSVKIVQLSLSPPRRLLAFCWHDIPEGAITKGIVQDPKVVVTAIREAFARCRFPKRINEPVVASIPETQSFLRVITTPRMAEAELNEGIQWEVAHHIPFGMEKVYIDWQPVPATAHATVSGKMEVLVGAAQRQLVDAFYETLQLLHVDVAALELESQAIVRALISPELRERQGLLIVDIGTSATNVIVHDHGTIRFTASITKGIGAMAKVMTTEERKMLLGSPEGIEFQQAEEFKRRVRPLQEELVAEIRGIVDYLKTEGEKHEVREILVCGGGANLPGLDQAFFQFFDSVHIQRGNPWINILQAGQSVRPPLNIEASAVFTTALGLAVRPVLS